MTVYGDVTLLAYANNADVWLSQSTSRKSPLRDSALIRKQVGTCSLGGGELQIKSQPFFRYLRVITEARANYKRQVKHVSSKSISTEERFFRLMTCIGPKLSIRALLSSVILKISSIYRLSALRVPNVSRTVLECYHWHDSHQTSIRRKTNLSSAKVVYYFDILQIQNIRTETQ